MESQTSSKRPKPATRLKLIKKTKKHHFKPQRPRLTSRPLLTNNFGLKSGHGLSDYSLGSGHAKTQQPQRPLSVAQSKPASGPAKQQKGTQTLPRKKLMEGGTTSKNLKSYATSYLPPPPLSTQSSKSSIASSQMPNQSKLSFKPQATGTGGPNFIEEQSLTEEAEVSTKYSIGEQVQDFPIRNQFQLPGSLKRAIR